MNKPRAAASGLNGFAPIGLDVVAVHHFLIADVQLPVGDDRWAQLCEKLSSGSGSLNEDTLVPVEMPRSAPSADFGNGR